MGHSDHMPDAVMDHSQQLKSWPTPTPAPAPAQWEPDHEPPMDGLADGEDAGASAPYDAPQPLPSPPMASPLAPLNHHNQVTRFLTKQTLGFIPKLSIRSPERTGGATSPPSGVYGGSLNFTESPRGPGLGASGSFRLPSLSGTPPLSPQKWSSASPAPFASVDEQKPLNGQSGVFQSSGGIYQRGGSFTEGNSSPIPPLKRALYGASVETATTPRTSPTNMSIADLCQPFRYMRSHSCPSDAMPVVPAPEQSPLSQPAMNPNWQSVLARETYERAQSCYSDAELLAGPMKATAGPSELELTPLAEVIHRNRLQRSSSLDAPKVLALLGHKRSAAESIDLHQWLDRSTSDRSTSDRSTSDRSSLRSLAESADSMRQLEQAGRSMRISDSPRSQSPSQSESQSQNPGEPKREKKLCAFPQCSSNAVTRGLCISHGGGRRCQRKGCTRGAQSKGLCVAHGGGRICRAAGCSNIQRSMGLCIRHGGGRRCRIPGCQKGVVRQDLCTAHGGKRKCRVEDCMKHVKKKGLCRAHANSLYASGSS